MKPQESTKILEIRNLSKYFVSSSGVNRAVNNVSFDLHKGEIIGLIGQSGSGKTTIGKTLIRIYNEANGVIALDGTIISGKNITKKAKQKLRSNMQMIFQDAHSALNEKRNIYSALDEALKVHKIVKKEFKNLNQNGKWKNATLTQEFTLATKFVDTLIDYYQFKAQAIDRFHQSLIKQLQEFKVEDFATTSEAIDSLYAIYFGDRLSENRTIITRLVKENKILLDFFLTQQETNTNFLKVHTEETNLLAAQAKLAKYKANVKYNANLAKVKIKAKNKLNKEFKEHFLETKKTFNAFIADIRTKRKFYRQNAALALLPKPYQEAKLNLEIAKLFLITVKRLKKEKKLKYLLTNQIFDLYYQLNKYARETILKQTTKPFDEQKYLIYNQKNIAALKEQNAKTLAKIIPIANVEKEIDKKKLALLTENVSYAKETFEKAKAKFQLSFEPQHQVKLEQLEALKKAIKGPKVLSDKKLASNLFEANLEKIIAKAELESAKKKTGLKHEFLQITKMLDFTKQKDWKEKITYLEPETWDRFVDDLTKSATVLANNKIPELTLEKLLIKYQVFSQKQWLIAKKNNQVEKLEQFNKQVAIFLANLKQEYQDLKKALILNKQNVKLIKKDFSFKRKKMEIQNKAFDYEEKSLVRQLNDNKILFGLTKVPNLLRKWKIMHILTNRHIYDMLISVGLKPEHAFRYPHEFSGGQKQRICIARALIINPQIIIADEPIASLDVSIQAQVINILIDLVKKRNIAMIFIGHDLSTIEYLADTIQVLHYGKVVERGDVKEIFTRPIHPYTKTLFESVPRLENANEIFKIYDSQLKYLEAYNEKNVPIYHPISATTYHDVLGLENQIRKWSNVTKKSPRK